MAPVSNLLHRTPWWALLGGGLVLFLGLTAFSLAAAFVTWVTERRPPGGP